MLYEAMLCWQPLHIVQYHNMSWYRFHTCVYCCLQVHLGDKPAIAMSQRMSQGIWNGTVPYLGAALLLTLTTLTSSATHVLPSDLLPVSAIATLGVLGKGLYSVIAPLLEIQQLSRLSAKEIEGAVDLREPLQVWFITALPGADSLLVCVMLSLRMDRTACCDNARMQPENLGHATCKDKLNAVCTLHLQCHTMLHLLTALGEHIPALASSR